VITCVFDTNVLASGIVGFLNRQSPSARLLHAWRELAFELATSEHILNELERTLARPYFRRRLTDEQVSAALTLLRSRAAVTPLTVEVHGAATHPEDDGILATAVSADADYLVTGDRKLLALTNYQGVEIASPRTFLELLESGSALQP
jgi:uncharacterized protein